MGATCNKDYSVLGFIVGLALFMEPPCEVIKGLRGILQPFRPMSPPAEGGASVHQSARWMELRWFWGVCSILAVSPVTAT